MRCSNCGAELPDNAKFCFSCGAKQEAPPPMPVDDMDEWAVPDSLADDVPSKESEETQERCFCPYCGSINDSDAAFCCCCGRAMSGEENESYSNASDQSYSYENEPSYNYENEQSYSYESDGAYSYENASPYSHEPKGEDNLANQSYVSDDDGKKKKKRGLGKFIGIGIGAVALVAVIVVAVKLMGGSSSDTKNYLNYMKDGKLAFLDIGSRKKEPIPYKGASTDAFDTETVKYSEDGKYMYFLADSDGDGFALYAVKTGKGMGDAIKIDSNIYRYWVMKSGKDVVYIKDEVLYKNNLDGEKEKIASDVNTLLWDVNEKSFVWCEYRDDTYYWYYRPMDLSADEIKLFEDGHVFYFTDDLQKLYALIEDGIYIINNMGEKEKVASDVVPINVSDDGTLYYTKKEEAAILASDLVNDDMAAADAAMKEPVKEDFVKTELKNGPDGLEKVEETDWDAYYEAWDAYYEKQDRDEIREELSTYTFDSGAAALYAYKDGQETLIDENAVAYTSAVGGNVIAYERIDVGMMPKINISEIYYAGEVEDIYNEKIEDVTETWIAGDGIKAYSLGERANCFSIRVDKENNKGYILTQGESPRLLSFDLSSEGSVTELAENVYTIEAVKSGNVYYISDAIDAKGDLYYNDKLIDSDVAFGSVEVLENSEKVCYAADINVSKGRFTLKIFDGKESKKVADDVSMFKFFDDNTAALLMDYSSSRYTGDLMLYTGKAELEKLDDGVSYIIGGRAANYYY